MPVFVDWHDESKTAIHIAIQNPFTWDDIYRAIDAEFRLLDTVKHPVGIIFDGRDTRTLPPGMLPNVQSMLKRSHPNESIKVFVGTGVVYKLFYTLFSILAKQDQNLTRDYRFTESLDQALLWLREAAEARTDEG